MWMRQTAWWDKATGARNDGAGGPRAETGAPPSHPLDYQKLENAVRHLRWARMMLHEMSGVHNGEELGWALYDLAQKVLGEEREVDDFLKKLRRDHVPGA